MKNTLTIIDNYLEQAIHEKKNVVDILDYILVEEAKSKKTLHFWEYLELVKRI